MEVWLKALHVAAVLLFAGGLLAQSLAVAAASRGALDAGLLAGLRRWDGRVTGPALLALWALGIAVALRGGWFGAGWLSAKLLLVVALSGLHGMQAGRLRRLALGGGPPPNGLAWTPVAVALLLAVIALLAVAKPF
ncbi:CopD family protein [Belnapia sp. T6]|uniref:Protoporphyrinogen IX oxidase n=1 Tax=Belnapia mucosa TaxID=2804532 RepID=A0ABS1UXK2_9PROT|nr:CopD family protein [Belnapia mucosa]MBL6453712.1 CopD family protein [Belnapia mucosa]